MECTVEAAPLTEDDAQLSDASAETILDPALASQANTDACRDTCGSGRRTPATENPAPRRPLEASTAERRPAPGDTEKELAKLLQAASAQSEALQDPDGRTPRGDRLKDRGGCLDGSSSDESPCRGRARAKRASPAEKRAAPGDTLREELAQMRLGADATDLNNDQSLLHTIRLS